MRLSYKNNSPDSLDRIYLQVPSNAFHDEQNTAVKEMNRFNNGAIEFDQTRQRKLTIESLQFLSIGDRLSFPLQAYDFSDTILDLALPYALAPGDTLVLGIKFHQTLTPRTQSGRRRNRGPSSPEFILWFPRVAVYDEEGWHPEPFHFMMRPNDVFSDFADMDVTLNVPWNHVVVASGNLVSGDPGWQTVTADTALGKKEFEEWHQSVQKQLLEAGGTEKRRTVRFQTQKIQDFIWTASPDYVHYQFDQDIPIHLFYRRGRRGWLRGIINKLPAVRELIKEYFGDYPFGHISIVDRHRGVSYPMMAYIGDDSYFGIAHALTNSYMPGIVGNNGVKEAWIANGMQIFMAKRSAEKQYGKRGYDLDEAKADSDWFTRQYPLPTMDSVFRTLSFLYNESGQNEPISNEIHEYRDPIAVLFNVYLKSELFYEMLSYVVGDSAFKKALREVFRRYSYSHITEGELQAVFEQVHGSDLSWFFAQWLHDTPTIDYSKGKVKRTKREDNTWITEVEITRKGDGIMPVDVEVELEDGKKIVKRWDGKDKSTTLMVETKERPKSVNLDPDDRIMDSNRLNNGRPRLEFHPDLPLLKYFHMPSDAIIVLWKPLLGYNKYDSVRLGAAFNSSYRAFYHNVTLEAMFAVGSHELDGKIGYSHPLTRSNLFNRYHLMARKNEGRFEADARLELQGANGVVSTSGRRFKLGINFSSLLNPAYTFRETANDTGTVLTEEWDDVDVLDAYMEGRAKFRFGTSDIKARGRVETALPGGDVQFTKLSSRLSVGVPAFGLTYTARGNLATSFGPDDLPRQDRFHAEGANPRERFQNDVVKTGQALGSFKRKLVEGGGFLRGYLGQALPAEKYATLNLEVIPSRALKFGLRPFGFFDTGRVWPTRSSPSVVRSDAGFGIRFLGADSPLFGGNLALFSSLSAKLFFPIWLSDPLPGQEKTQFRWYVTMGKAL